MTDVNGETAVVASFPDCDVCSRHGAPGIPAAYDGATVFGPWAYMCPTHFAELGRGLGTGRGQRLVLEVSR
jgi:hypothetical protein